MLRTILIDDEPQCLTSLSQELALHCPEVQIVSSQSSSKEGLKAIHREQPDLVFLDIDMPFLNGFELLELVPNIDFEVVFTTAYDKYALQAFKISAADYLLKPIEQQALKDAVKKAKWLRSSGHAAKQVRFLLEQVRDLENNAVRRVALPIQDGFEMVLLSDIIYCQSDGAYTRVFIKSGDSLYLSRNLRFLEDMLCEYHFFRVHHSYIVNLHEITRYSRADGGQLWVTNGDVIKVSRSKKEELLKLF
ncbi:MAG: LytTR family DNA-binding domain-containing protein [Bacteroidota bacterium]